MLVDLGINFKFFLIIQLFYCFVFIIFLKVINNEPQFSDLLLLKFFANFFYFDHKKEKDERQSSFCFHLLTLLFVYFISLKFLMIIW